MTFIDRWSDNIDLDRVRLRSWHYQPSRYNSHTMKSSDPLLLVDGNLCCGMYPAGKVAISRHLATIGFSQVDHTVGKLSADAGSVHCVVKYSRPPNLKSSSNVSLPFAWITGPQQTPARFLYSWLRLWPPNIITENFHLSQRFR